MKAQPIGHHRPRGWPIIIAVQHQRRHQAHDQHIGARQQQRQRDQTTNRGKSAPPAGHSLAQGMVSDAVRQHAQPKTRKAAQQGQHAVAVIDVQRPAGPEAR